MAILNHDAYIFSSSRKSSNFISMTKQFTGFVSDLVKIYVASIPMAVNFDITCNCNLRCEHCYYWSSIQALGIKKRELDDDEWVNVFKYYNALGIHNVSLTGGEPTLRMNVIAMAHKYFPQVQTATNGIIRIPEKVQPRGIWLSIDGPEEVHNKIRRSKNVFQQLQRNYQDDKRIIICSTLSTSNYKYIDDIVKIGQKMNVKGVVFMIYSFKLILFVATRKRSYSCYHDLTERLTRGIPPMIIPKKI